MSRTNLHTLLTRFGQKVGLPDIGLDDDNFCMLRLDGALDLSIEFVENGEYAIFSARCGALVQDDGAHALRIIAEANFHWAGTGGGTLSLNARENTVYLQYREPTAQMDQIRLENVLQALVNNAEHWIARLAALEPVPAVASRQGFIDRA